MTGQETRYDRIAEGYATYWSPVHRAATLRLLDEVAEQLDPGDAGRARIVDVGCGTGAMAVAAATRWPGVEVEAVDLSRGMLALAARTAAEAGPAGRRIHLTQAPADRLPFPDQSFDVALSAFVLQLVPSRARALREMRRVLRPGGRLAYVGWLEGELPFAADAAWEEALDAAGVERESGGGHDDLASPEGAAAQLRAAGLSSVTARADHLVHQFTPEGYAAFVTQVDDGDLMLGLEPEQREAIAADLLGRLRSLSPADLRL
ncbi:MAG TPA: methyltransferase domain-containing protein, partial [Candidatus Limnocylindrales bacterium]